MTEHTSTPNDLEDRRARSATAATETLFVTGATGFVGSHFVLHATQRGQSVVALVRGTDEGTARARLVDRLREVAASYGEPLTDAALSRLSVCVGELDAPFCGVSSVKLETLRRRTGSLWHFAASLNFEDRHRETIERINVHGAEHVLQLAETLEVERYNHVSTAYTCGPRTGLIPETLHDPGGPFNNHYERTKCLGEHLATAFGARTGTPVSILRPSIVVGPERTKLPGGSDSGVYGFAREINRLKRALATVDALHIRGEPECELNYMPVDRLVEELFALHDADYPGGPVYHLTSESSPSVAETMSAVAEAVGVCPIVVDWPSNRVASPIERMFERRADFYRSYLKYGKRFARAIRGQVRVSYADLSQYLHHYVAANREQDAPAGGA